MAHKKAILKKSLITTQGNDAMELLRPPALCRQHRIWTFSETPLRKKEWVRTASPLSKYMYRNPADTLVSAVEKLVIGVGCRDDDERQVNTLL